jgi:Tfp pilus assembly protein PilN
MKSINLLPKSEQKELKLQSFVDQLTIFWVWVVISLAFFLALTYVARIYLGGQVSDVESQINSEKQVLKSSDNELLKQQVEGLNAQINAIKNLQSQHYYWSQALDELAKLLPADISLDSLSADRTSGKVQIQGVADTRESVLKFWADMHKSAYFKNIDFPLANLDSATKDPFSFTFFIVPDKLKSP